MTDKSITLLHISDVQFGRNHQFGNLAVGDPEAQEDTLFGRMSRKLRDLADEGMRPQVIVVSGDLAEQGRPQEFKDACNFLIKLSDLLLVPRSHVVIVPGNHDVSREKCRSYFDDMAARERPTKPPYWPKWEFYVRMFRRFFAEQKQLTFTSGEPWTYWVLEDLKLAVVGLNSTLAESHQDGDHYGRVGERQMRRAVEFLEPYERKGWFRLGVVHHNTLRGATEDDENLRDAEDLGRILGPHLHLLLHGHTHDSKYTFLGEGLPVLSTGSASLRRNARPPDVPNQFQTIRLNRSKIERWTLAYDPRDKEWIPDVRGTKDASWKRIFPADFSDAHAALGRARATRRKGAETSPRGARPAGSPNKVSLGVVPGSGEGDAPVDTPTPLSNRVGPHDLGTGGSRVLEELTESMLAGQNVMLIGKSGVGKTRILEALVEVALGNASLTPIPMRIDAGDTNPKLTLMRALHLRFGGNFMPDDGDDAGLRQLRPIVPAGTVLIVDEVNTGGALRALAAVRDEIEDLTVIAASQAKEILPGFSGIDLPRLTDADAQLVVKGYQLEEPIARDILRRSKGNPQRLRQRAAATATQQPFDGREPNNTLLRSLSSRSEDVCRLIDLLPSSLLGVELLQKVGGLLDSDIRSFEEYGAGEVIQRGNGEMGCFVAVHPDLVKSCSKSLPELNDADRESLLQSTAKYYCEWIESDPQAESMHAALDNLIFVLEGIHDEPVRAQLLIALVGDDFDDPKGYIPSRGLARLLLAEAMLSKLEATAASDAVPLEDAGAILKNLGLLLHRANRPKGEYLLRQAIDRYGRAGCEPGVASAKFILGEMAEDAGAYHDALKLFREPRLKTKDPEIEALSHHLEGCAHYHWENYRKAKAAFKAAKACGGLSPVIKMRIDRGLAYVDLATGKPEQAKQRLTKLQKRAEQLDRPREAARCTRHVGQAQLELQQVGSALASLRRAEDQFRRLGDRRGLGATLRVRAAATRGDTERRLDAKSPALESQGIANGKDGRSKREEGPPPVRSAIGLARANEELARIEELTQPGNRAPAGAARGGRKAAQIGA